MGGGGGVGGGGCGVGTVESFLAGRAARARRTSRPRLHFVQRARVTCWARCNVGSRDATSPARAPLTAGEVALRAGCSRVTVWRAINEASSKPSASERTAHSASGPRRSSDGYCPQPAPRSHPMSATTRLHPSDAVFATGNPGGTAAGARRVPPTTAPASRDALRDAGTRTLRLEFGRFHITHRPTGQLFHVTRGEQFAGQHDTATAYYVTPGRASRVPRAPIRRPESVHELDSCARSRRA